MRDRFLVLAADAALAAGQDAEAERLRGRLLQHNPHHLLKPYSSFAEAMASADVQNYVSALRRNHPYDKAENLLINLHQRTERPSPVPLPTASPELGPGSRKEAPARLVLPTQSSPSPPGRPASAAEVFPKGREPYPALDKLWSAQPE